jgi:hypothetical protein
MIPKSGGRFSEKIMLTLKHRALQSGDDDALNEDDD